MVYWNKIHIVLESCVGKTNYKSFYEFYGVPVPEETNGSEEYVTDCPFCGHENHFFINSETGQFSCKDGNCAMEGNQYTFLNTFYEENLSKTVPFHYKKLSYFRKKFHKKVYEEEQIAFSRDLKCFLLPIRNANGTIVNLGKYSGEGPVFGSPGSSLHLFGLDSINPLGPIYLCEGQWDRYALLWLLRELNNPPANYTVLGVPGAQNLPKLDMSVFNNRDVYVLYDNDSAGKSGAKSVCKKLSNLASSIHILAWPEGRFPEGYDVEDYIRESTDRKDTCWDELLSWCFKYDKSADPTKPSPTVVCNTFDGLIHEYIETGVHMYPDLIDCLAITLAVVKSASMKGEPLWMYCIGDPGRGKSLILESTLGSSRCVYRTSVTHKSFISGYRVDGEDNSLLAFLPGKSLVVKDYSNVLSLPHVEQEQLIALLREAYDGCIARNYGNNVYREYKDCRFSFVAGVTKEIHSRNHAGLGERFLKYEITCSEEDNLRAMMTALDDSWKTHEMQLQRSSAVGAFLATKEDSLERPITPEWFKKRLVALSQFVGYCRSPVSRTRGDLDYSPSPESGTRIAKQLLKLSQALAIIFSLQECDEEVYRLIQKVAWDTAHGWRRDLLLTLFYQDKELNTHEVEEASGFSLGTVHRQLHDMRALGVVHARKEEGFMYWSITPLARKLITQSKLETI